MLKKQTKKWKTKTGDKIRICDMEDSHLKNTINFLSGYAETERCKAVKEMFSINPDFQGEMAQYQFDKDFDFVMESTWVDYVPEVFTNLVLDAKRRSLDLPEFIKDWEEEE